MTRLVRVFSLALLLVGGCGGGGGSDAVEVQVVGVDGMQRLAVVVDVASDEMTRRVGLSGRASLPAGQGLLIVLPVEGEVCFTNRDVDFAIDAVFAAAGGDVIAIEWDVAARDAASRCHAPVRRILELGSGEAAAVRLGDRLLVAQRSS